MRISAGEVRQGDRVPQQAPGIAGGVGAAGGAGQGEREPRECVSLAGEVGKAIKYDSKHLEIAEAIGDRVGVGNAYNNLALALQKSGRPAEAAAQASRALAVFAEVEGNVGSDALRISLFAAEQVTSYRILQEVLLETARPGPALAVAELSKARALSDALGAGAAAALAAGGADEAQGGAISPTTPAGGDGQAAQASGCSGADLAEEEWRAVQDMARDECCVVEYSELSDGECSGDATSCHAGPRRCSWPVTVRAQG